MATQELAKQGKRTLLQIADDAAGYLETRPARPYRHVIVDEAQDLHEALWRLLRAAVPQRPDDLFLLNRAGWLLATSADPQVRNGPRAVDLALHATRLTNGQDVVSLDTLAAAYAEVGRFAEAAATATEAIRLASRQRRADILPEIEARLALYRAGRPFRQ